MGFLRKVDGPRSEGGLGTLIGALGLVFAVIFAPPGFIDIRYFWALLILCVLLAYWIYLIWARERSQISAVLKVVSCVEYNEAVILLCGPHPGFHVDQAVSVFVKKDQFNLQFAIGYVESVQSDGGLIQVRLHKVFRGQDDHLKALRQKDKDVLMMTFVTPTTHREHLDA